jgi:hypothetical protein
MRKAQMAAIAADQDRWMRQATDASIAAAKDVVGVDGPIRPTVPIGRLARDEWGWIASTVVWAWVATRAEQAATEGWNVEQAIRTTSLKPDPWSAGAVAAILPKLAEACPDLDWSQPVGAWPKDDIVQFLLAAFGLIQDAFAARDVVDRNITGPPNPDLVARQMSAAAGNPLMTIAERKELGDVPF